MSQISTLLISTSLGRQPVDMTRLARVKELLENSHTYPEQALASVLAIVGVGNTQDGGQNEHNIIKEKDGSLSVYYSSEALHEYAPDLTQLAHNLTICFPTRVANVKIADILGTVVASSLLHIEEVIAGKLLTSIVFGYQEEGNMRKISVIDWGSIRRSNPDDVCHSAERFST